MKDLLAEQETLKSKIENLKNNKTKEYRQIADQYALLSRKLNKLEENLKKYCGNNLHNEVLLFLGYEKDDYEGRTYMSAVCLNCGERIMLLKGNMEQYFMLNGKESFPSYFPFQWTIVRDKLMKEYHSLQECYEKNPEILKETDKKPKMIYKVMRKRYETK